MKVQFTQSCGIYSSGAIIDLPDQVANNFLRAGAAQLPVENPVPVAPIASKTAVYTSAKGLPKAMKKAL